MAAKDLAKAKAGGAAAKGLGSFVLNHGINAAFTGFSLVGRMKEGESFGSAAVKEAGSWLLMETAPTLFWGVMAGQMAGALGTAAVAKYQERSAWLRQNTSAQPRFNYVDTEAAYTMRSAAVQAIQGSKLNARSALGGEARLLQRREAYNRI
jgi:hypothetical protein